MERYFVSHHQRFGLAHKHGERSGCVFFPKYDFLELIVLRTRRTIWAPGWVACACVVIPSPYDTIIRDLRKFTCACACAEAEGRSGQWKKTNMYERRTLTPVVAPWKLSPKQFHVLRTSKASGQTVSCLHVQAPGESGEVTPGEFQLKDSAVTLATRASVAATADKMFMFCSEIETLPPLPSLD
jgi:hypothetical protein